jgi:Flp pilus assembly protein CpaB
MGRRTFAILIFVVGILILAVIAFFLLQQGGTSPAAEVESVATAVDGEAPPVLLEAEATLPATVDVYVSLQTVPRGFQYPTTEEELEGLVVVEKRVAGSVGNNVITNVDDILGLYVRNDVFQGETLTQESVVDDPTLVGIEDFGPSSLIPPGSIAAAIPMDRLNSVAYALDEGDTIDIMITFLFYKIDEEFQTYLQNAGVFFIQESIQAIETGAATGEGEAVLVPEVFIISPYGRFEELPTGDLAHISPTEFQRPIPISMILQNAKVIQVGEWTPPELVQPPTPVPTPSEEEAEVTPTPFAQVTPIPEPPDVLVVALSPQQQLFVKYAIESHADIDFALRGPNDTQLYTIENIDLDFILQRFGINVPENLGFSVDIPSPDTTPTPGASGGEGGTAPEGG